TGGPLPSPNVRTVPRAVVRRRLPRRISRAINTRNSQSMAPTAKAVSGPLASGGESKCPSESGRNGRVDPDNSFEDRWFPGPFQGQNKTEAAIIDKSGPKPPNIGHFSQITAIRYLRAPPDC